MLSVGIKRLVTRYPAMYFRTIMSVMAVLLMIALVQHRFVVRLEWHEMRPHFFIVPVLVGIVFGFLIASIRALLREQQQNIIELSAHDMALQEEIRQRELTSKKEQRLTFALEGASDGMWDWNIVSGEVYYSPRWIEMLGYKPEDVPPHYDFWANRVHPDDVAEVQKNLQRHLRGETDAFVAEFRFRGSTGEWVWVLGRGKVMERDVQGHPLRAVGTQTDITEQKRIAAAVEGLLAGTAAAVGESFFPELVRHLALTLDMRCAVIGSLKGEGDKANLLTLAAWPADIFAGQQEIPVAATPCTRPACGMASVIAAGAATYFPDDPLMIRLKAESYIGQPLLDKNGATIGILATLDDRPLPDWKQKLADKLFPIFAARAAAELERRNAERALKQEKERAQITLASLGEAVISTNAYGHIDFMNAVAGDMTGWSLEEALGKTFSEVCPILLDEQAETEMDFVAACLNEMRSKIPLEPVILVGRQGNLPVELSVSPIMSGHNVVQGVVAVLRDVSHTHEMARQMTWQATHDTLTGLVNRKEFERQVQEFISYSREQGSSSALLYLDLDQFKIVNDTCGHSAGDELLRQISQLLLQRVRQSDTLARLGGDEFGVILHGCDLRQAKEVADKIIEAISNFRFAWQDKFFDVGVSIGMVMLDRETLSVATALSAADVACYAAKDAGRNRSHVYQPNDAELARRHGEMQWVSRIRHALEENRFVLCVQRIRNLRGDGYDLHEVLIRMLDEHGNLVPPGSFISSAERYGLMPDIDRWVIDRAFKALASGTDWLKSVSINLSGLSLTRQGMNQYIAECQTRYSVDASRVCFEITETAAIANLTRAIAFIHDLKSRGFKFALDDFGSGLSSFSYLKNLPVDYLKIDGSFVYDMCADPIDLAMVQAINGIGHTMGIRTIAEYVNDDATLAALKNMGVDYAQGYFISQPAMLEWDGNKLRLTPPTRYV
jgi:diguanylate cyclase (GGDEF)-like protein/PAS domain S-box-containing protein